MTFNRNISEGHYIRFPKGMYTDVKKLSTALYSPARDSNAWLENIVRYNRTSDVYVFNNNGEYFYDNYKPLGYKRMFQYTLGGL